ncbi:hypothetical protein SAICODRAFT_44249, partial [Saitoella complicata NRRL Y-17804]|uniref:uncharacterized protein n=1 Tax=Saitoella complicata (strain BCRC 22490 / CBS 7301 / JCM 7358 / NBRC 10748 / NRRL Y-17804) TaxID=698492 RepID=UPI000866DE6C
EKLKVWAAQRNAALLANHALQSANYSMDMLVFLDESSIDNHCTYRKFGYSPEGNPACKDRRSWTNGMLCHACYQGSFNADRFVNFIADDLMVHLNPYPESRSVVVMDNCATHHDPRVKELI